MAKPRTPQPKVEWLQQVLPNCWCDPDRDDVFTIDCPTHGVPRSSLSQMSKRR